MPWVPGSDPSPVPLHLRTLTRAIADLSCIHKQQNNRAHAAAASHALSGLVKEMQQHQKYFEQRMTPLRREALRLIASHFELNRRFRLRLSVEPLSKINSGSFYV